MVSCTRSSASWGLFVMRNAVRYRLSSCARTPASKSSEGTLGDAGDDATSVPAGSVVIDVSLGSAGFAADSTTGNCSNADNSDIKGSSSLMRIHHIFRFPGTVVG